MVVTLVQCGRSVLSNAGGKQSPFLAGSAPWKSGRSLGLRFCRQVHPLANSDDVTDHLGLGGCRQPAEAEAALAVTVLRHLSIAAG